MARYLIGNTLEKTKPYPQRSGAAKRTAGTAVIELDALEIVVPTPIDDRLLAMNEALGKLAMVDPRKAELVKLR